MAKLTYLKSERILRKSKVLIVLDHPLKVELTHGYAFSAPSLQGGLLAPLRQAGIDRKEVQLAYLASFLPPSGKLDGSILTKDTRSVNNFRFVQGSNNIQVKNYLHAELEQLKTDIAIVQPDVIVCAGKFSLMLLTGVSTPVETMRSQYGTLLTWRGSHLKLTDFWNYKKTHTVLPILPPASLFRMPKAKYYQRFDFARISMLANDIEKYSDAPWDITVGDEYGKAIDGLNILLETLNEASSPIPVSADIETEYGYMDCISFTYRDNASLVIPIAAEDPWYWTEEQETELTFLMIQILTHENTNLEGQNWTYDMQYLFRFWGIDVPPAQDTMIDQHVLSPASKKDLATLSSLYCTYHRYWKEEGKLGKGATRSERWTYNGKDTAITYNIARMMDAIYPSKPSLKRIREFQTKDLIPVVTNMMNRGVNVNIPLRAEYTVLVEKALKDIEDVFADIGLPYNLSSPLQLKEMWYDVLKAPKQYDIKTRALSTNKAALRTIGEMEILYKPIVDLLDTYRSLSVTLKTFLRAGLDVDGRLRTAYNVSGTDTYRFASRKNAFGTGLNMQNLHSGKETPLGINIPSIKKLIIPDEGYTFFDADLGSADARIVAYEYGVQFLMDIFYSGEDLYATLASEYYGRKINKGDKERKRFKAVAHATHYLGSAPTIASNSGLLVHEVEQVQRWYFSACPELLAGHRKIKGWVDGRGYLENVFGYRYYFLDNLRKTRYQQAAAWIPQSTIAILINKVMVGIENNLPKEIMPLLQVHDSVAGQYKTGFELEGTGAKELILQQFEIPLQFPAGELIIPSDLVTSEEHWHGCK